MSDHPSLHRNNIRAEFHSAGDTTPASLGRFAASETAAALKAWGKKHPNPFAPRRASQRNNSK